MMRNILILVAAACLPSFLLLFYVYRWDRINKEPIGLLIKLFIAGCLASVPAYLLESFILKVMARFEMSELVYELLNAFLVAAFSEELLKLVFTKALVWKHPAFDSTFDGIIYCVFTSIGFATAENLLYGFLYGVSVLKTRAVTSLPGHFAFAVIMGIFLSRCKQHELLSEYEPDHKGPKTSNAILALLMPILFHGFYDFCVMWGLTMFTVYYVLFKVIRRESREDRLF